MPEPNRGSQEEQQVKDDKIACRIRKEKDEKVEEEEEEEAVMKQTEIAWQWREGIVDKHV